jgi:hypothetical protein
MIAGVTDFTAHQFDPSQRSDARAVLPVEFVRAAASAVYGRLESPQPAVGLHQPQHRLLGAAETLQRAVRNHPLAAGDRLVLQNRAGCVIVDIPLQVFKDPPHVPTARVIHPSRTSPDHRCPRRHSR